MAQVNVFNPLQAARFVPPNPTALTTAQNFSTIMRNRAYARLDASSIAQTNPDFDSGAAGRILASIADSGRGNDPRITRGYIRRSTIAGGDPTSGYRLYFMYNPETIQRQYVEYLNQAALDPFNTVFNSGNLVAPPGVLNFSFDLFFDRQVENANGSMPRGVLEDFDYFDLVIRGVVPDASTPDLPDNGILLINPRNITVVFSPQLSVQGRPNTASVNYMKFDHMMRPIRMQIHVEMMAFYIGPVRPDFTFAQSKTQGIAEATIPYEQSNVKLTVEDVKFFKANERPVAAAGGGPPGTDASTLGQIGAVANGPAAQTRSDAVSFAEYLLGPDGSSRYDTTRPVPTDPKQGLDCSGLIFWAYRALGALALLGFTSPQMTGNTIRDNARRMGNIVNEPITEAFLANGIQRGDVFVGDQHVAWCAKPLGGGSVLTYEEANHVANNQHYTFNYGQIVGSPNNHQCVIRPNNNQTVANP